MIFYILYILGVLLAGFLFKRYWINAGFLSSGEVMRGTVLVIACPVLIVLAVCMIEHEAIRTDINNLLKRLDESIM